MKIDFLFNEYSAGVFPDGSVRRFDPKNLLDDPRGLSGTEINIFGNALALGLRGHTVRIFSVFKEEAKIGNVEFLQIGKLGSASPSDVAVAYHDMNALDPSTAKVRAVSHHTYSLPSPDFERLRVDVNFSPTQRNLDYLRRTYAPSARWHVLPNACDLGKPRPRHPISGRIVFHTSAERGLHLLLRALPEIRRRVPDAHVRVLGNLSHLAVFHTLGPKHGANASEIMQRMELEKDHVIALGHMSRNLLLDELSRASVYAYPSDPPISCEVSPISIMECCMAGVPVVLSPSDGIEELYGDAVSLVPPPAPDTLDKFIDATVAMLTDTKAAADLTARAAKWAETATFERTSAIMEGVLSEAVHHKEQGGQAPAFIKSNKRFAFLLHPHFAPRPLNPDKIMDDPRGLTGSDKAFFAYAREFASRGHEIVAFSNFTHAGTFWGARCLPFGALDEHLNQRWDGVVAINDPRAMGLFKNTGPRYFNQQCNDFLYCTGWEHYTDVASSPSKTHLDYLKTLTTFDKWFVANDGCYPEEFSDRPKRAGRVIHASSPDRGLHWLLDLWPEIKKAVPEATLDIYYEFNNLYEQIKRDDTPLGHRVRAIKASLQRLGPLGVQQHGSISCNQLAQIMSESSMMLYPCDPIRFTEGFSVTTLECAVAGCLPVIVGVDALKEVYDGYVPMVEPPYTRSSRAFLQLAIDLLRDRGAYLKAQQRAREIASVYDWRKIVAKVATEVFGA